MFLFDFLLLFSSSSLINFILFFCLYLFFFYISQFLPPPFPSSPLSWSLSSQFCLSFLRFSPLIFRSIFIYPFSSTDFSYTPLCITFFLFFSNFSLLFIIPSRHAHLFGAALYDFQHTAPFFLPYLSLLNHFFSFTVSPSSHVTILPVLT